MTSGRVVALLLLFTPVCVFSQDQSKSTQYQSAQPQSTQYQSAARRSHQFRFSQDGASFKVMAPNDTIGLNPEAQAIDTNVCFKMRTYVVARDSKDSDSTHPVRYTTCTPANARIVQKTEHSR
jgi:hypothetical protein